MSRKIPKYQFKTVDLAYIALFAALMTICSWISIPLTVPFTLQTFAVFASVAILGTVRSTLVMVVYMLLGAIGVPVFSGVQGGISRLVGPTGGYLLGFLLTTLLAGMLIDYFGKKAWVMALGMILGLALCYAFGTAWFMVVYGRQTGPIGLATSLSWCVFPFIIPDLVKMAVAIVLAKRVGRYFV